MAKFRTRCIAAVVCVLAVAGAAADSEAPPAYPERPIRILVGFTAGSGGDQVARVVGHRIASILGQPVLIENRPGAAGMIATQAGARAPADGYTLTLGTPSSLITAPALSPSPPYDSERDFSPVSMLARTAFVLVGGAQQGAPTSLAELSAAIAAGGQAYASNGTGTIGHLASAMFLERARLVAQHVPYNGSARAMMDVAGGQVLFMSDSIAAALPLLRAGRLRALAVTSRERAAALPEVPTFAESGVPGFDNFTLYAWWGLLVPAHTDPQIVKLLERAAATALASEDVQRQLKAQELEPFILPAPAFAEFLHQQTALWLAFLKPFR